MTQNQNEGFDAMIWNSILKSIYVSFSQLQLGINDAVPDFSVGRKAKKLMFEKLNMISGEKCLKDCKKLNENGKRLSASTYDDLETKSVENLGVGKAKPKENKSNCKEPE